MTVPIGCAFAEVRVGDVYIGKLAVAPSHRGRGLARRMVEAAADLARAAGKGALGSVLGSSWWRTTAPSSAGLRDRGNHPPPRLHLPHQRPDGPAAIRTGACAVRLAVRGGCTIINHSGL